MAPKKYVAPELPNTVPLAAGVERLEPEMVFNLLKNASCVLVDVRGEDRAAGLIEGAVHVPAIDAAAPFASRVPDLVRRWKSQSLVVFTCQYSAHRAPQCANWYREQADPRQRVAILSGGFRGWEGSGLPVQDAMGTNRAGADAYAIQAGNHFVNSTAPLRTWPQSVSMGGTMQMPLPFR